MKEPSYDFQPLSSDNKAEGWNNYLRYLPLFLEHPRPASREIRLIHRLVTRGADRTPQPIDNEIEAAFNIITQHQAGPTNARDAAQLSRQLLPDLMRQLRHDHKLLQRGATFTLPTGVVGVKVFMPRRGHVRQFGQRTIAGESQRVYAPHCKPLYSVDAQGRPKEEVYLGLTKGLDALLDDLADRTDRMHTQAQNFDDHLRAMMFLQLLGASVLHPFFDGNGRAFAGKLILDLQRQGLLIHSMPGLPEVDPKLADNCLAGLGPMFLDKFLEVSDIPLLQSRQQLSALMADPKEFDRYMNRLQAAITAEVALEGKGIAEPYVDTAADVIYMCLSRDGFADRSFYDDNIAYLTEHKSQ